MGEEVTQPKIAVTCPKCGGMMVRRTNRSNGSEFLGCSHYPDCTYTQPLPEDIKMRELGQIDLFSAMGQSDGGDMH
jgi:ssDNA-binding Zn-finger/Zn-ribbon topoisomerase 1